MVRVVNQTKGTVVAERVGHARTSWRRLHQHRLRALSYRRRLYGQREVVKVTMVKPWRVVSSNGHCVLELPAGRAFKCPPTPLIPQLGSIL